MFHPIFIIPLTTTFWLSTRDALRYLWPRAGCPRRRTTSFDRSVRQPRQSFLDHLRISNLERSRLSFLIRKPLLAARSLSDSSCRIFSRPRATLSRRSQKTAARLVGSELGHDRHKSGDEVTKRTAPP